MTYASFYVPSQAPGEYESTPHTAGPWSLDAQHGGPPAALLAHALDEVIPPGMVLGRFTMDLLGAVPVGTLTTTSRVLRPGRRVSLLEAEIRAGERLVARAQAWAFPASTDGPGTALTPLSHSPADGRRQPEPPSWKRGYLDAVDWRWIKGSVGESGPGLVWMRPRLPLVAGQPTTAVERLLTCIDSASGASAVVDPQAWGFMNTELTVSLLRPPVGEWVCLDAETTLGPGAVGVARSTAYDELGVLGFSSQTLLVARNS